VTTRPSDAALWRSVESTLRDVVLGAVADPFARLAVVQLIGLARYASTRGLDPVDDRREALGSALDQCLANTIVARHWPGPDAFAASSAVLVDAVGRDDVDATEVRTVLRTLLVEHLDADLADNNVLLGAFRGQVPDA
jgi:hypothetical protein